jgi:hypothetical protein
MQRGARSTNEKNERRERGVLFGSGLVGGEGLLSVAIAGVVFYQKINAEDPTQEQSLPMSIGTGWTARLAESMNMPNSVDLVATVGGVLLFGALIWVFARRCRTGAID